MLCRVGKEGRRKRARVPCLLALPSTHHTTPQGGLGSKSRKDVEIKITGTSSVCQFSLPCGVPVPTPPGKQEGNAACGLASKCVSPSSVSFVLAHTHPSPLPPFLPRNSRDTPTGAPPPPTPRRRQRVPACLASKKTSLSCTPSGVRSREWEPPLGARARRCAMAVPTQGGAEPSQLSTLPPPSRFLV